MDINELSMIITSVWGDIQSAEITDLTHHSTNTQDSRSKQGHSAKSEKQNQKLWENFHNSEELKARWMFRPLGVSVARKSSLSLALGVFHLWFECFSSSSRVSQHETLFNDFSPSKQFHNLHSNIQKIPHFFFLLKQCNTTHCFWLKQWNENKCDFSDD